MRPNKEWGDASWTATAWVLSLVMRFGASNGSEHTLIMRRGTQGNIGGSTVL